MENSTQKKPLTVTFFISKDIPLEYMESLNKLSYSANKVFSNKEILFQSKKHNLVKHHIGLFKTNPDEIIKDIYIRMCEDGSDIHRAEIYIPDTSINLFGNYLWYSIGNPNRHVMVLSTYIYDKLLRDNIDFGNYCFLLYMQYLSRYTVGLKKAHSESRNCLNDFCSNQVEVLNVLKNENIFFCSECESKDKNKHYYYILNELFRLIKRKINVNMLKARRKKKTTAIRAKVDPIIEKLKFTPTEGHSYEIEVFMAKKLVNLSKLYKRLDKLLKNITSKINGYSLYGVEGGWRDILPFEPENIKDFNMLKNLRNRHGNHILKDVIRPLIDAGENKYAIFSESSIVLKIIITNDTEFTSWDLNSNPVIREIAGLFEQITRSEKSIFVTVKNIQTVGNIETRISNVDGVRSTSGR